MTSASSFEAIPLVMRAILQWFKLFRQNGTEMEGEKNTKIVLKKLVLNKTEAKVRPKSGTLGEILKQTTLCASHQQSIWKCCAEISAKKPTLFGLLNERLVFLR